MAESWGWEGFRRQGGCGEQEGRETCKCSVPTTAVGLLAKFPPSPCVQGSLKAELLVGILHHKRAGTGDTLLPQVIPPTLLTFLSPFLPESGPLSKRGQIWRGRAQNARLAEIWAGGNDLIPVRLVGEGGIHPSLAKPGCCTLAPLQPHPSFFRRV